ncbi:IucA/IucC family protein [Planosporangium flavigriseum]|uniref:Siderophore synthetase component n=1 Tax=Planosporangium flavigriseum TaxID=373681 RepID=A0A8J3LQ32_9ACTN|nr:MFS transporter [Planosporangium flavigriseum]GIG75862.1 hypothetical protein Pfl04_42660 [Planosporangium flavigriseum]
MTVVDERPAAAPIGLSRGHILAAVAGHCTAAFAALGLPPYLPAILPALGDPHARWAGALYVIPTAATAVSAPLWGRLADRFGRRRLLIRAQLGLACAFWLAGQAGSVWQLAAALALQGLLGGTFAATGAYLATGLSGAPLARALTLAQASARLALAAAPTAAGLLAGHVPAQRLYTYAALLPLLATALTLLLPEPGSPAAPRAPAPVAGGVSLRFVCAAEAAFVLATVVTFPYLLPVVSAVAPGAPAAAGGVLFALPHVIYLVAAAQALRLLRERPVTGLGAGFALAAAGAAAHPVAVAAGSMPVLVAGRAVLGAGLTAGLVSLSLLTARAAATARPGLLFGTVEAWSKAGAVTAGLGASLLAGLAGPAAPAVAGAAVAATAAVLLLRTRTVQELSMTPLPTVDGRRTTADEAASHTLLGCLTRELAGPEGQLALTDDDRLMVRLPRQGALLRVAVARRSTVGAHRFTGPVHRLTASGWQVIDTPALAALVAAELELRTGVPNEEFVDQVTASRDALARVLRHRPAGDPHRIADPAAARYVASEQALVYGHPRHPAPKWRTGDADAWDSYAPELRTAFPLRWVGAPRELIDEDSVDGTGFSAHLRLAPPDAPSGYVALPVHPWQWRMLARAEIAPRVARALADGTLVDLGEAGPPVVPTASVRTLYSPEADVFVKTSLHVRITNCLRKNARYELPGAVHLTRLLAPVAARCAADLGERFALLPEPAYRTVNLGTDGAEALGVIVRTGLGAHLRPGQVPLLAGALATADPHTGIGAVLGDADPAGWWRAYLELLVPTVLRLWAEHGVVLEPHLQNVLVVVDPDGWPVRVLLRDLEGTKLVTDRHAATLAALPPEVAAAVGYDPERAWHRVAYCLFVNHLVELAGALADARPGIEPLLWDVTGEVVAATAADLGTPPPLRALLAGVPLPAKANLLVRWERRADRHSGYVPFPNPLGVPLEVQ